MSKLSGGSLVRSENYHSVLSINCQGDCSHTHPGKKIRKHVALQSNWIISGLAASSPVAKRLGLLSFLFFFLKSLPVKRRSGFISTLICWRTCPIAAAERVLTPWDVFYVIAIQREIDAAVTGYFRDLSLSISLFLSLSLSVTKPIKQHGQFKIFVLLW